VTLPRVVILNGVSSVGKSSVGRALQEITQAPMLYVAMDDYLSMLPRHTFGTPEGLTFITRDDNGSPSTEVVAGVLVRKALADMRCAVAALAAAGNDVIVDDVMFLSGEDAEYRRLMPHAEVRLVALTAPLAIVEARECARGDRTLGLARWQFDRVHHGRRYDLEIDTSTGSPANHAMTIRDRFDL
jgi:chloramphenicol 3-O phosphotransferase